MAVLLAVVGVLSTVQPAAAVNAEDPVVRDDLGVQQAEDELVGARRLLLDLSGMLDDAAAAFEQAQAHHLRLAEEVDEAQEAITATDTDVDAAQRAFAARVAAAYKRPAASIVLSEAVLTSPDPATAVHRAALLDAAGRHDVRVQQAEAARRRTAEITRQARVLRAGTAGATAVLHARAGDLADAVDEARQRVDAAEDGVAEAEQVAIRREHERRAEEQRKAEARRQAAAAAARAAAPTTGSPGGTSPSSPPPAVDGKVCPVGLPNGFIDSWGFPRSGGRRHQGVDIFAAHGTPLYAVADGTIQRLTSNRLGGLSIHLLDDAGDRYYYAHLSSFAVKAGQRVHAGDVIGAVGNTGNARTTPPHLHWQQHPGNGAPVNPYPLTHALCRG